MFFPGSPGEKSSQPQGVVSVAFTALRKAEWGGVTFEILALSFLST